MRVRRIATVGVACAAAVLLAATAASAVNGSGSDRSGFRPPADSLRALAAPVGLRIGNAVNMDKLNVDAAYTALVVN